MENLRQVDNELNEMTSAGQILEALERFYSEDCTFQEGNKEPMVGRQAHHDHLTEFFATLKEFKGATLHSQGVGENATLTEWTFDMVGPDGPHGLERSPAPPVARGQSRFGALLHRRLEKGGA